MADERYTYTLADTDEFLDLVVAVGGKRNADDLIKFVGTYRKPRELHLPGCWHFYYDDATHDQRGTFTLASTEQLATLPQCSHCVDKVASWNKTL